MSTVMRLKWLRLAVAATAFGWFAGTAVGGRVEAGRRAAHDPLGQGRETG